MKKLVLLLCLAVFALSGCGSDGGNAQKVYTLGVDAAWDEENTMRDYYDKPITGIVKELYDNGNISSEWPFKKGKAEGQVREFFNNGEIRQIIHYSAGKREGVSKLYLLEIDLKTKLAIELSYENGIIVEGYCVKRSGERIKFTNTEIIWLNNGDESGAKKCLGERGK